MTSSRTTKSIPWLIIVLVGIAVLDTPAKKMVKHASFCLVPEDSVGILYDRTKIVHLKGVLESEVHVQIPPRMKRTTGPDSIVHIVIASKAKKYEIHVSPLSYVQKQKFSFKVGETLEIDASSVINCSDEVLLAGQISAPMGTLQLRDAAGKAKWAAR